ncbi:N-acetyltransferase 9 [Aspergillus nanangensis]|uniref:N-acetyltransferase 9 n=1 Tax=Aspergillus nanangensis TaxID=2582783 RepID=A0AAD4CLI1_ASPNN|nr:N-acetyltransferase 9 [Aspergillus nanangensis]
MQQSWRQDPDKLTFIICLPTTNSNSNSTLTSDNADSPSRMVGDINLFLRIDDGDDGASTTPQIIGEIELMIAEKTNQRKGFGRAALLSFLRYIIDHEAEILREFVHGDSSASASLLSPAGGGAGSPSWKFACLSVKIGQANVRSLALFESVGFEKVALEPNYFGEFELRRVQLGVGAVDAALERAAVRNYTVLSYGR